MSTINDASGDALADEFGRPISDELQEPRPASADYADALLSLLPPGSAWPKNVSSTLALVMAAIAPTFASCAARAKNLLLENPISGALLEMLPEWEQSLGLPDACAGPDPTTALRQAHVRARFIYTGGQSIPYFTAYAAALGYTITITEFAPARADVTCADDPCYEPEWSHIWQVNAPVQTVEYAAADISYADDPLLTTGNGVLECELGRIKPAHTILLFNYVS